MVKAVDIINRCEESLYNEEVTTNLRIHSISSIKCAAHTLQLAVKDFMLSLESVEVIEKASKIVKLLRTPSFRYLIAEESLPQPVLDVATRWCSTYQMLKKLQTFQSFCEKHLKPSLKLTSGDWDEIGELTETFEPAFIATEKLQSSQLFMGDFYKLWVDLKLTITVSKATHSQVLRQYIEDREESLFANNAVLCSIYLDPRIRRVLLQKPLSLMLARPQLKGLLAQIFNIKKV
ncbi:uncharacterized protein LOC128922578 [Zeugodacus cucurbitae]|uniref:uncharacterized protein LOC128922578 n=1 Tax=Zeugodacus cucurbitae TaxID=28588 RepID=UPI0023D93E69|nr:uncharacterized protein LOC128922578 [Zeugodacus cucurbitae]